MRTVRWLGLMLLLFISSCAQLGGNVEEYYPTYDDFKNNWDDLAQYLPENSSQIRHFAVLDFDTNYHFFDAAVEIKSLEEFVLSRGYFDCEQYVHGCSYTDGKFDSLFYKRPDWWNQEGMSEFQDNCLIVFADNGHYGKGCWLFFDHDRKKIRVFTWSEQWLTREEVLNGLDQLENEVAMTRLEGTWQCQWLSEGLSEAPSSEIAAMSVSFSDDAIIYRQGETPVMRGTFKIKENTSPKQLDIVYEDGDEKIQIPAIFEIKQRTLKLCHSQGEGGDRPADFQKSEENCLAIFEKVEDTY